MAKISSKNQITVPIRVLEEARMRPGDDVVVEAVDEGELRVRGAALSFDDAFGALTGQYPRGYLERLDAEDAER